MSLKQRIEEYKKAIFSLELAGLLHDTGKLDSRFIDYRKKWQGNEDGWNYDNDPHNDEKKPFFDYDPLLKKAEFETLNALLSKEISSFCSKKEIWINGNRCGLDISLKELVHQHTRAIHPLSKFLKVGDSIDSAHDRNNPLMAMEQGEEKETFISTVFGYESSLNVELFDTARELLYCQLNTLLPEYLANPEANKRKEIFNRFEDAFKIAVTDTCRPANDIPLWQHAYMTTAICKVSFLHFLIYGEQFKESKDCKFSLLGFGWDGLGFISKGLKIGDIIARKEIVKRLKKKIKDIIEYAYPIGMNVYDDDNGTYFIIPAILEDKVSVEEYKGLLQEIINKVLETSNNIIGGEIMPVISEEVKDTHYIMDIVKVIDEIKKKSQYPYSNLTSHKPCWFDLWNQSKDKNEVCSVCQCRPLMKNQSVCSICIGRRKFAQSIKTEKESIFTEEIADKNGRLALIVARFSLEPWLSGDMLWSLFVKESHSLKEALDHLTKIKDLKDSDKERLEKIKDKIGDIKNFSYDYEKIKKHIDSCQEDTEFAKAIAFLFDKHKESDWNGVKKWIEEINERMRIKERFGQKPDLYNYLLTKNHTPSRLLNIWNTTREFLNNIFEKEEIKRHLLSFRRIELLLDKPADEILPDNNAIYEATIGDKKIELVRDAKNIFLVTPREGLDLSKKEGWKGKEIIIAASEFEKKKDKGKRRANVLNVSYASETIYPYRVITTSPDLLMALVPADKAVEISKLIYEEYLTHFGKVLGRLPFSIGNIFFPKKTPMFVVLDAGRRMNEEFAKRYKDYLKKDYLKEGGKQEILELTDVKNEAIRNNIKKINLFLGDGKRDYFHPYLIVEDCKKNIGYDTFLGKLVHFSEIEKGFKIKVYPNCYDFEFLDSTARRYDLTLDENYRRKSNLTNLLSKPYFLDELKQGVEELWNLLRKDSLGMTDTKLRNIESLWLTKLEEWRRDDPDREQWKKLVKATIKKEFKGLDDKELKFLEQSVFSCLFFDCLELNLRILKKKIKEQDNEAK